MNKFLISLFILISLSQVYCLGPDGKCRALALRGGGTKGAYEVGALKGIVKNMENPVDYQYDVVGGVSVGAINAALIALYEKGTEQQAMEKLEELWLANKAQDLWREWPYLSIVEGLWKSSFLDNQPMYDLMYNIVSNKTFHRKVAFQSVDMSSGKVVIFDENTPDDLIVQAIVSSGSLPIIFTPQYIENLVLVDGGVFTNLDLSSTIVKCRQEGVPDEKIIVDIIMCFDKAIEIEEWTLDEARWKSGHQMYQRRMHYKDYYYYYEDILRVIAGYPDIDFRFIVVPSRDLPTKFFPIYASQDEIEIQLKIGEEDTTQMVKRYYEKQKQDGTYKPYVPPQDDIVPDIDESSNQERQSPDQNKGPGEQTPPNRPPGSGNSEGKPSGPVEKTPKEKIMCKVFQIGC